MNCFSGLLDLNLDLPLMVCHHIHLSLESWEHLFYCHILIIKIYFLLRASWSLSTMLSPPLKEALGECYLVNVCVKHRIQTDDMSKTVTGLLFSLNTSSSGTSMHKIVHSHHKAYSTLIACCMSLWMYCHIIQPTQHS